LGGVIVLPLHPRADAPARRIIMLARKGSRRPLQLLPGLVLHSEGGGWTEAARNILEQGQALDLEAAIETGDKGANRVAD
jgi:tRNA1(Val) A37 N6-methylase TrmN6